MSNCPIVEKDQTVNSILNLQKLLKYRTGTNSGP